MKVRNTVWLAALALLVPAVVGGSAMRGDASDVPDAPLAPEVEADGATAFEGFVDPSMLVPTTPATPAADDGAPYVPGYYLVRAGGADLEAIAAEVNGRVVNPEGRSGLAVIASDEPDAEARLLELGVQPGPCGRILGATDPNTLQWHRGNVNINTGGGTFTEYKVAILDTGVAYENYGAYTKVSGMTGITFSNPKDYVNNDTHANDDHQHGTHIASIIGSTGGIYGIAPQVGIIPIKVLDSANAGTEWALVEGLWWAIDHDADVINLSLAFPLGYVPSAELSEAIAAALDAGILVVGASGNQAQDDVAWPAAAPGVLAVGSRTYNGSMAPYSNSGPAVQILAPGGRMDQDLDSNGYGDGILAQTIALNTPATHNYVWMEGTSQATAITTGAAIRLMKQGIAASAIPSKLQRKVWSTTTAATLGTGAPNLDITNAISSTATPYDLSAGVLPYVTNTGVAKARVSVVDHNGYSVTGSKIIVTAYTETGYEQLQCQLDGTGVCTVTATPTSSTVGAWAFRVDAVVPNLTAIQPARAVFVADGTSNMLAAVNSVIASGDVVGVKWPSGSNATLGSLSESWVIVDNAPGLLGVPYGLVFLPSEVSGYVTASTVTVNPQSTGLVTGSYATGLASMTLDRIEFVDGLLDPMPGLSTSAYRMFGAGLVSSPMGTIQPPPRFRLIGLKSSTANKFDVIDMFASSHTATTNALGLGWGSEATLVDRQVQYGSGGGLTLVQTLISATPNVKIGGLSNGAALTGSDLDGAQLDAEDCTDCEDIENSGDIW